MHFSIGIKVWLAVVLASSASAVGGNRLQQANVWNEGRAAHLLRRAGFGGTPEEIRMLRRMGLDAAVDYLVDYRKIKQTDGDFAAVTMADMTAVQRRIRKLEDEGRDEVKAALRALHGRQINDLRAWWLRRMMVTPRPLEEKMTLFWHGHFTSEFRKIRDATPLANQNDFLRRNALGNFRDLLIGISRDPAMLRYLDNDRNLKKNPNENYARELLELFTLGEGHYTEDDVRAAALAFTGWSVGPDGFVFKARHHDDSEKVFLKQRGDFDGGDVIDIILRHRGAAFHLADKLLRFFVQSDPPRALVHALADDLRGNRYDIRKSMRKLFKSEVFYSSEAMHSLIKSPVELIVGSVRLLEAKPADVHGLVAQSRNMGQDLFQPPNVKGWDGGQTWINTATLFTRYNFAGSLLRGGHEKSFRRRLQRDRERDEMIAELAGDTPPFPGMVIPSRVVTLTMQPSYNPGFVLTAHHLRSATEIIDHFVNRLVQMPIDDKQRTILLNILSPHGEPFDYESRNGRQRLLLLINAIMTLPEFQLS